MNIRFFHWQVHFQLCQLRLLKALLKLNSLSIWPALLLSFLDVMQLWYLVRGCLAYRLFWHIWLGWVKAHKPGRSYTTLQPHLRFTRSSILRARQSKQILFIYNCLHVMWLWAWSRRKEAYINFSGFGSLLEDAEVGTTMVHRSWSPQHREIPKETNSSDSCQHIFQA